MQRIPSCSRCHHAFGGKDPTKPHGPRMPLLLECGHTFCEGCLTALAKQQKDAIICVKCQVSTPLKSGEASVKQLCPDIYMMGILSLNRKISQNQNQLKLNSMAMMQMPKKKTVLYLTADAIKVELCRECNARDASCCCVKCDALMCKICFDRVHKTSKILQKHQSAPLPQNVKQTITPKTCSEHDGRLLEYFCDSDQTLICSHCFIVGDHQGHQLTALEEKNAKCVSEVQSRLQDVNQVLLLLKKSDKAVTHIGPDAKLSTMALIDDIKLHFANLHSLLQAREAALINEIDTLLLKEMQPIYEIRSKILTDIMELEETAAEARSLMSNSNEVLNAHALLQKMLSACEMPCYVECNQEMTTDMKWKFPEEFQDQIKNYGEANINSGFSIKMSTLKDIPEDVLEELKKSPLTPDSISTTNSEVGDLESETRSVTSEASSTSVIVNTTKKLARSRVTSYKQELVYVTHIKNPCFFMVQRVSDYDKVTTLNKSIKRFCIGPDSDKAKLLTVEKDDLVLSFFNLDQCWYRARVVSVETNVAPIQIEVFYIDYGNSEIVPIDRLRAIQNRFLKVEEMSMPCSLCDIESSDESGEWSSDAIDAFARMTNDKPLVMTLLGHSDNMATVDLSKPGSEDIEDDRPVSIRDALVFLEFARFTSPMSSPMALIGNCKSGEPLLYSRKYLPPDIPCPNEKMMIVISHIDSPKKFCVQIVGEEVIYLNTMMTNIQQVYSRDKKDTFAVYVPQVGMICIAQFTDGAWYRAQVVSLPGRQMVVVKYVDFGNSDKVHYTKLKKIKDEFLKLAIQAVECELADIEPPDIDEWSEQALHMLAAYYQTNVEMHVQRKINNNKISVILNDKSNGDNICLNSMLVENGLARCSGPSSRPQFKSTSKTTAKTHFESKPKAMIEEPTAIPEKKEHVNVSPTPQVETPHVKVVVSYIVNPGHLYVQLHTAATDGLLEMMEELQKEYVNSEGHIDVPWEQGDFCAVCYSRDGRWYRAKIEQLTPEEEQVQVHLIDYGYKEIQQKVGLRILKDSSIKKPCYSVLCHLADIQPAGDITKWSQTAIEALREKVDGQTLDIVYKDSSDKATSLAIDLLMEDHVVGSALSAHQLKFISLSDWLKERGLALPKRRASPDVTSTDQHEEKIKERSVTKPIPPPTTEAEVDQEVKINSFPPAEPPTESVMQVIPTYVDYDCVIYAQPLYPETSPLGRFGYILKENTVEIVLQDQYLKERGLYRAKIPRDGNCLFRCFSQGIWGDQSRYHEMREKIVKGISENWWLFQNIIGDTDKEIYLREMAVDGVYGGEPEIQAICHLQNVSAKIYLGGLNYSIQERGYGNSTSPCINLCYVSDGRYDSGHYDLIVETIGAVNVVEQGYDDWRSNRLIELTQSPSTYNTVFYDESLLAQLMETIQQEYVSSVPDNSYVDWYPGQPVIARYPDDLFYRGVILQVDTDTAKVHFIDFGDTKLILKCDLRKKIMLASVPQQCYQLTLNNICPLSRSKWSEESLTYIHSMMVNKTCTISIQERPYKAGDKLVVDVILPDMEDLGEHLIKRNFAKKVDNLDTTVCSSQKSYTVIPETMQETKAVDVDNLKQSSIIKRKDSLSSSSGTLTPAFASPIRPTQEHLERSPEKGREEKELSQVIKNVDTAKTTVPEITTTIITKHIADNNHDIKMSNGDITASNDNEDEVQVPEISSTQTTNLILPQRVLNRTVPSPFTPVKLGNVNDLIPVQVTQVDSPTEVYLQFLNQTNPRTPEQKTVSKLLNQLIETQRTINTEMELYPYMEIFKPGTACCAQFSSDQSWYRAEIIDVEKDNVGVIFVDYGNSECVSCKSVKQIPPDLLEMPAVAVRCCLNGVNPPACGDWTQENTIFMQNLLAAEDLLAVIKENEDCEPLVELYGIEEFRSKGVGASLIYEPFLSQFETHDSDSSAIVEECYEELIGEDVDASHKSWGDMVEESEKAKLNVEEELD